MRPGKALAHAQVNQQLGGRFEDRRRAAAGMEHQLRQVDVLLAVSLSRELFGQVAGLTFGAHPANHVATEDIQNIIEIEVLPGDRPFEHRDVPGPELIRLGRQELRPAVDRIVALVPTLKHFVVLTKATIRRAY